MRNMELLKKTVSQAEMKTRLKGEFMKALKLVFLVTCPAISDKM